MMARTKAPGRLWDFCATYHSDIRNLTVHPLFQLHGCMPYELVMGQMPDISEYTDYAWYDNVRYYDQEAAFPADKRKLAKWPWVAHQVGQALCYYLLLETGHTIVCSTAKPLSYDELHSETIQQAIQHLNNMIETKIIDMKQPGLL
jgi:hypothetical protein